MASYARDIYFGVRVEDRATRPLRRIVRDMRLLGKQGLAQRQAVAKRGDLTAARAQNTRRAAAQEYLAAKRAYDLDLARSQLAVKRAAEAKRVANESRRAAKSAVVTDVQAAVTRAENAQSARRRAASKYLDLRSGATRIAQAQREAQFIDRATQARLKSAGVLKGINALERQRIGIVTQVEQAELALAQRTGTALGKKYEENLAKAATINPRVLSRSGRGILMSGLSVEQLKNKIKSLRMAQNQLVRDEDVLAEKAGLASGALNKQRLEADRLAASEARLNAQTVEAGAAFRSKSNAARQATAAIPVVEAAAQAKVVSTTKDLTIARQRYNLAVQAGASIEANATARLARSSNTLRTASDGYRLAKQRAAELNEEVNRFRVDRLKGIAMYIRHIGAVLGTVGAVGVFAFASMGKAAADFSTQVTLAATQSTMAGRNSLIQVRRNANFIQKEIQASLASGKVTAPAPEQATAAYKIFSGVSLPGKTQNAQLKEGIQLLKEFNKVATANYGLVTLEEATRAGIILFNRFGVSVEQMPKALNTFQAAVRYGDLTMSEFLGTLGTVAPAAQGAGYNVTQMSSAIAFLSKQFSGSLRMGTTGYARLLETFAKKDIIAGLKQHGVAITNVRNGVERLLPIEQIAQNILDKFGGSFKKGSVFAQNFFKEIGNAQGTVQARRVLITYMQHLAGARQTLKDVTRDHNELRKSLAAAQESPGVRWQEFVNQLKALTLEIGAGVLPAVGALSDHVRRLAGWFNGLSPTTKRAIGYFGALISVFTLLGGIFLTIVGGAFSLALAFGAFSGAAASAGVAAEGAAAGTAALAAEAGFIAPELAIVLAALVALGYAYYKYPDQTKEVIAYTKKIVRELTRLDRKLIELTSHPWKVLFNVDIKIPKGVSDFFKKHMSKSIKDALNNLPGGPVITALYDFWKGVKNSAQTKMEAVKVPRKAIDTFHHRDTNDQTRQFNKAAKNAADALGATPTQGFKKLFDNLVKAKRHYNELKAAGASSYKLYLAQLKIGDATTALTANASKQQVAAAQKAATAAAAIGSEHTKHSDAFVRDEAKKVAALAKTARHEKTYAAWKKYYTALDKLQGDATTGQMSALEKMFNLDDTAAKRAGKLSDAVIIKEARNVAKLAKIAKNSGSFTAYKAFYKALDKLQNDASSSQMSAVQQMFDFTIDKATQSTEKLKTILGNVRTMYDNFLQQNQSAFGQIFNGPYVNNGTTKDRLDWGQVLNMKDLVKDLASQVKQFHQWRNTIDKLRRRGLPTSLIDQIVALGPEAGMKQAKLLAKATPEQLAQYKKLWLQGQKEVHAATMRDLKRQLAGWRRHGRNIALAIAQGLRDENLSLQTALLKLIKKMLPDIKVATDTAKKKKVSPNVRKPASFSLNHTQTHTTTHSTPVEKHDHTHYHVTTTADPKDAKRQVKDANFHHRTRK